MKLRTQQVVNDTPSASIGVHLLLLLLLLLYLWFTIRQLSLPYQNICLELCLPARQPACVVIPFRAFTLFCAARYSFNFLCSYTCNSTASLLHILFSLYCTTAQGASCGWNTDSGKAVKQRLQGSTPGFRLFHFCSFLLQRLSVYGGTGLPLFIQHLSTTNIFNTRSAVRQSDRSHAAERRQAGCFRSCTVREAALALRA